MSFSTSKITMGVKCEMYAVWFKASWWKSTGLLPYAITKQIHSWRCISVCYLCHAHFLLEKVWEINFELLYAKWLHFPFTRLDRENRCASQVCIVFSQSYCWKENIQLMLSLLIRVEYRNFTRQLISMNEKKSEHLLENYGLLKKYVQFTFQSWPIFCLNVHFLLKAAQLLLK